MVSQHLGMCDLCIILSYVTNALEIGNTDIRLRIDE
jgi:hypothetical protein